MSNHPQPTQKSQQSPSSLPQMLQRPQPAQSMRQEAMQYIAKQQSKSKPAKRSPQVSVFEYPSCKKGEEVKSEMVSAGARRESETRQPSRTRDQSFGRGSGNSKLKTTYTYEQLRSLIQQQSAEKPMQVQAKINWQIMPKPKSDPQTQSKRHSSFHNQDRTSLAVEVTKNQTAGNSPRSAQLHVKEPKTDQKSAKKLASRLSEKHDEPLIQLESVDFKKLNSEPLKTLKEFIYKDPGVNIGKGKFGPVDLIIVSNELRALKRIAKLSLDNKKRTEHVQQEKNLLQLFAQDSHPAAKFIVTLYETFSDQNYVCFVFEYLNGQDLFWVLQNEHNLKLAGTTRKKWVTFYCAELLVVLKYLHSKKIVYRDLKPDNVMIDHQGHVKLIDFGFAKQINSAKTYTNCGTLGYVAPEVLSGTGCGYDYSADIWSFGVLIVELLTGTLPFENKTDPVAIQQQTLQGKISYNTGLVDNTTRDLLAQMFVTEPNLRISLKQMSQHKFFSGVDWKEVSEKKLPVPYTPNPMKYKYLLSNTYPDVSNLTTEEPASAGKKSFMQTQRFCKVFDNF